MKTFFGWLGGIIAAILIVAIFVTIMFGATWAGIEWRGFFGKKEAGMEREVFKESQPYQEGKNQELANLYFQWNQEDATGKVGIEATVRHRFGDFNPDNITDDELANWLRRVRRGN